MYHKFPSHPYWPKGEQYYLEPALGGPLKVTIEHDGLHGVPSYLEPAFAGFSIATMKTETKVIAGIAMITLLAVAAIGAR